MQRFARMGVKKEKPRYKPSGRGKKWFAPAYFFLHTILGRKQYAEIGTDRRQETGARSQVAKSPLGPHGHAIAVTPWQERSVTVARKWTNCPWDPFGAVIEYTWPNPHGASEYQSP